MPTEATRARLIDEGIETMRVHGYDAAGLGPILARAGVPKGSFYHFFASKKAFAATVVEAYAERCRRTRQARLQDTRLSPIERLDRHFADLERRIADEQPIGGCLMGNLAQHAGAQSNELRRVLAKTFDAWQADLRRLLEEAARDGELKPGIDTNQNAAFIIDAYEGALIRTKADGGIEPIRRFRQQVIRRLAV